MKSDNSSFLFQRAASCPSAVGRVVFLFVALFFAGICTGAAASGLETLVGVESARALRAGEAPVLVQFRNIRPQLMPNHGSLGSIIGGIQRELSPSVMVETLHVYRKPEGAGTVWTTEEKTALANGMLALSSLAGLQYFSSSRGAMRTFYDTSFVIDGPQGRNPLPDPVFSEPPRELTIFARQRDLTFGDNTYRYDFITEEGAMIFIQQNITSLSYGIVPAVGRNRLRSVLAVIDAEEYLLVYAASMARTATVPGVRDRIGNSFSTRAEALFRWFSSQADEAYRLVLGQS